VNLSLNDDLGAIIASPDEIFGFRVIFYLTEYLSMEHGKYNQQNGSQDTDQSLQRQAMRRGDEEIYLTDIFVEILSRKWLFIVAILLSLIVGIIVVLIREPVYQAESLIQIEDTSSGIKATETLEALLGGDTTIAAEMEILNSRMILERVVESEGLNIVVEPKFFPLVGKAISRHHEDVTLNQPWFGFSSYAWGGEEARVDSLFVREEYLDKSLTLIVGKGGAYTIENSDKFVLLNGIVGERAESDDISIFVSMLTAREGIEFKLRKLSNESAVSRLRSHFSVRELGKQSGILELSYTGYDVDKVCEVLDTLQDTYLRLNVERRSAQAEKTLEFLETQLPELKQQVNDAEVAYNEYRQSRGSLDLNIETQGVLDLLIQIDNDIMLLTQQREELRQRFTVEHPTVNTIDAKLAKLRERRKQVDNEVSRLPDTQQTILRLARDMEVSTNLYTELLNTTQQLKVSKAGTIGEVRIIDRASASRRPVNVAPIIIIGLACVLGFMASVAILLIQRRLRTSVDEPESIEAKIGLPVYATIPHSRVEATKSRQKKNIQQLGNLLSVINPDDDAIESMRSLRTALYFALLDASHQSLLITGPSPSIGKTFLAQNLSVVLSQIGKKIVLVDSDLRRGSIHSTFNLKRDVGISEFVANQAKISEVVKPTPINNLFVVTTGQIPPNPSEMLMHFRFEALIRELRAKFDTLIFDAPPVLAVSDSAIIGRHVGATLLVARAGQHPIVELEQTVKILRQAGVQAKGFIFNDININRQRNRYGYKGYVYHYAYNKGSR
jgi:tyrosine-protein kinase Etk/Wzc